MVLGCLGIPMNICAQFLYKYKFFSIAPRGAISGKRLNSCVLLEVWRQPNLVKNLSDMNSKSEGHEVSCPSPTLCFTSASRPWPATFPPIITWCFDLRQRHSFVLTPDHYDLSAVVPKWLMSFTPLWKIPGDSQIRSLKKSMWEATDNLCKREKYYSQQTVPPWGCGLRPLLRAPALWWNGNMSCTNMNLIGKIWRPRHIFLGCLHVLWVLSLPSEIHICSHPSMVSI